MTVYLNTTYVDWLEELANPATPDPKIPEHDADLIDKLKLRLHRKGLALDLAKIGNEQHLTRCEASRIYCFCLEIGTKKNDKKRRKTLDK